MPESMIQTPVQVSIEHYQRRAQELRTCAMQAQDADSRRAYIWLATKYEFLVNALWRRNPTILQYQEPG